MKFLIDFRNDAVQADIDNYLQQNGCTVIKNWNNFDKIFLVDAQSQPPMTNLTERVAEEQNLVIQPLGVTTVDPYFCTHRDPSLPDIAIDVGVDKDWWKNYSLGRPEFENPTTKIKRLGQSMTVYVMDSGIEISHPEFANANITNLYSVTGDFDDHNGHGTALTSVIVGSTCGVTAANIKIVKIFDQNHVTTEIEFLDAIDAIINDHVDNTFSILNASWSIPKNAWVEHKLRILEDEGVFIVTASGNNGMQIQDVTPASMTDVITVGAYNQGLLPCDFSNYSGGSIISVAGGATNYGYLDGWAPGEMIWAAGLNGTYGYVSGTSVAAAITSAILASNLSCYVDRETKQRLLGYETMQISTAVLNSNLLIFRRSGLLDLSDEKYQNSLNLIATFGDRDNLPATQASDEFWTSFRVGQSLQGVRLYQPTLTKDFTPIVPLPNNFEMLPDGRLYGKPDASQGPGPGEIYKLYVCSFSRTNIDDTVETITVNIYVIPENLQPENVPTDDQLYITLTAVCSGLATQCDPGTGGCQDLCSGGTTCCDGPAKGSFSCVCQV